MSVIIELKNQKMPKCCNECWAKGANIDSYCYFCRITKEKVDGDFDTGHNRMPSCPMKERLTNDYIFEEK